MNHVEIKQDLNIVLRMGIILAAVFALATIGSAILFFVMVFLNSFCKVCEPIRMIDVCIINVV